MKEHTEARDIHDGTNGADDQINQNLHRQRRRRRTVMEDTVEGPDTIFPINFLTFLYGPRSKADCTFIDPASRLSNFCSHLRLEAKTVFSKINSLNDSGFEAVSNVHNEVTICALKPLREGETGHAHFWIPRRQLSDRLVFCASADRDGRHGACCSSRHNPIIASADSR